jgi:hypothetical protein
MIQSTVIEPYSGWTIAVSRSAAESDANSATFMALTAANAATASAPPNRVSRSIHTSWSNTCAA